MFDLGAILPIVVLTLQLTEQFGARTSTCFFFFSYATYLMQIFAAEYCIKKKTFHSWA